MSNEEPTRRVLLAGASGLVGGECLDQLLRDPSVAAVTAVVRRPFAKVTESSRLRVQVVDFDRLEDHSDAFAADQVVCALGTTIRQAGSQDAFRRVDFDLPMRIARLALSKGARHFLLVSALGADQRSRVFYNRVKGELEVALEDLAFRSLTIARPSLLLGDRTAPRLGEEVGRRLSFLLPGRYKGVQARQVAAALVHAAREDAPGRRVIENTELRAFSA